jgi:hypothetical protein
LAIEPPVKFTLAIEPATVPILFEPAKSVATVLILAELELTFDTAVEIFETLVTSPDIPATVVMLLEIGERVEIDQQL